MKKTIEKELAEINKYEEEEIQEIVNDSDTSYSHALAIDNVWERYSNERLELAIRCWERGLTEDEMLEIFHNSGMVEEARWYAFPEE